jgi:hypothetical protein
VTSRNQGLSFASRRSKKDPGNEVGELENSHPRPQAQARTPSQWPRSQSRTQSMPVRRLGAGHDSGEMEYRISNFGYPVSCAHAHGQTATLNLRGRH